MSLDLEGNTKFFLNNIAGQIEDGKLLRIWGSQRDITEIRAGDGKTLSFEA